MRRIESLFNKYVTQPMTLAKFLERLELEKERAWTELRMWWQSTEAFDRVWDDIGGFDDQEFERRVNDAFYFTYSSIVRRTLDPIFYRPASEFPELAMVIKKVEPFLLSDVKHRLLNAETIEDVYFAAGDEHSHWLVAYLVDHLRTTQAPR